jgi:hypothetical protein
MLHSKNRKEITLDNQTLSILQIQAEKQGRKLKNFMEQVLKEQANSFELTDEYKAMMDAMLVKHEKGELKYTSWEDVQELTSNQKEELELRLKEHEVNPNSGSDSFEFLDSLKSKYEL